MAYDRERNPDEDPWEDADTPAQYGYVGADFLEERGEFFVKTREQYLTGCSDDRPPTDASAEALAEHFGEGVLDARDGYARFWGAKYGMAVPYIVTRAALEGPDSIRAHGSYAGVVYQIKKHSQGRVLAHSDETTEASSVTFDTTRREGGLGCLLCNKIGAAAVLLTSDETILRRAYHDQSATFGDNEKFDEVIEGFRRLAHAFGESARGSAADFQVGRRDFSSDAALGGKIMILAGAHAPARQTAVVQVFEPRVITNPRAATEAGQPFYSVDATAAGESIGGSVHGMGRSRWDWDLFMRASVGLTTVVRAALAAQDKDPELEGVYNPANLAVGSYGDPAEAIRYLNTRYHP